MSALRLEIGAVERQGSVVVGEAQDFATEWLWTYNNDRPNMGIGGITPAMKLKMPRRFYECTPLIMGGLPLHRFLCPGGGFCATVEGGSAARAADDGAWDLCASAF